MLTEHGLADRLLQEADRPGACECWVNGKAHEVDYGTRYDGQTHYIYPRQEVVQDLVRHYVDERRRHTSGPTARSPPVRTGPRHDATQHPAWRGQHPLLPTSGGPANSSECHDRR
ncbi:hypothetical protein [Saccharothrix luteola]|uniref:hypothetical protein n=1 Tax=Saccharothrix luteola TaxID=2893018 RepID=UPI003556DCD0